MRIGQLTKNAKKLLAFLIENCNESNIVDCFTLQEIRNDLRIDYNLLLDAINELIINKYMSKQTKKRKRIEFFLRINRELIENYDKASNQCQPESLRINRELIENYDTDLMQKNDDFLVEKDKNNKNLTIFCEKDLTNEKIGLKKEGGDLRGGWKGLEKMVEVESCKGSSKKDLESRNNGLSSRLEFMVVETECEVESYNESGNKEIGIELVQSKGSKERDASIVTNSKESRSSIIANIYENKENFSKFVELEKIATPIKKGKKRGRLIPLFKKIDQFCKDRNIDLSIGYKFYDFYQELDWKTKAGVDMTKRAKSNVDECLYVWQVTLLQWCERNVINSKTSLVNKKNRTLEEYYKVPPLFAWKAEDYVKCFYTTIDRTISFFDSCFFVRMFLERPEFSNTTYGKRFRRYFNVPFDFSDEEGEHKRFLDYLTTNNLRHEDGLTEEEFIKWKDTSILEFTCTSFYEELELQKR